MLVLSVSISYIGIFLPVNILLEVFLHSLIFVASLCDKHWRRSLKIFRKLKISSGKVIDEKNLLKICFQQRFPDLWHVWEDDMSVLVCYVYVMYVWAECLV